MSSSPIVRWRLIGRLVALCVMLLFVLLAYCHPVHAETSIAAGADVLHVSGEPMVFIRHDITPAWSTYAAWAGGQPNALGVGIDYAFHGYGALNQWSLRFGAAGWNHETVVNGATLNFSITLERRLSEHWSAGVLHTSAARFLGFTSRSNEGRNVLYLRRAF